MPASFKIIETGALPWLPKRLLARPKKQAYMDMGKYWHAKIRPKHFTIAGAREYKYVKRSLEYTRRKLKFGPARPLVWTGESEQLSKSARITATSKGVKVFLNVPTLNRPTKLRRINMREELTSFSERDVRVLTKRLTDSYIRRLNRIRRQRTKTIRAR
jgi:hypothetical protein